MEAVSSPSSFMRLSRGSIWSSLIFPMALVLASIAALPLDIQIASFFVGERRPALLTEYLEICEVFGHGFGATLIVIAVVVLDPSKLRCLVGLFAGSLGAGVMANVVKQLLHRTRPRDFDLAAGTVWETFSHAHAEGRVMQSMPSAHTATAVGLAVVLTTLYPRGRWYFSILAALVGVQRIWTNAHFPSDVLAGAAVGYVVGMASTTLLNASRR